MRRREFIAGLGSAVTWPLAARGQQAQRVRRVGVLMFQGAFAQSDVVTFQQTMLELGWTEGRNLTIDYRWGAGNDDRIRSRYRD